MLRRFTLLTAASLLAFASAHAEVTPPTAPPALQQLRAMKPLVGDEVDYDWEDCTGGNTFANGWIQYSVTGAQTWQCTTYGRDATDPTQNAGAGPGMNGYDSGNKVDVPNEDWLISPAYDLTTYGKPTFGFWSREKFLGDPLTLRVSTNYKSGAPSTATWTTLTSATFPTPDAAGSAWTQSAPVDLSTYKATNVHVAFVYTSTSSSATRWNLDDFSLKDAGTLATHTGSKVALGLYPNPATNSVRFDVPELGSVQLEAFTADGRLVLKTNGTVNQLNQALNQQLGSMASGIYMVRVTGTQQVYTSRLVKK